jgi:hypothetical protein
MSGSSVDDQMMNSGRNIVPPESGSAKDPRATPVFDAQHSSAALAWVEAQRTRHARKHAALRHDRDAARPHQHRHHAAIEHHGRMLCRYYRALCDMAPRERCLGAPEDALR